MLKAVHLTRTMSDDVRERLRDRLGRHNVTTSPAFARGVAAELDTAVPFELTVHREEHLVGGLAGSVRRGWLDVDLLWVSDEARGQGIGRMLLDQAEQEAQRMGARHVKLSTFDFQAPAFYQARGYSVYGVLEDYPAGCTLYLLRKDLSVNPASEPST
ncbi:GNAT family N-acetyltransferase [Deinococcus ficus]|nr:GNAT family N-acetyltransferase [Deinococcus ficus]